MTSIDNNKWKLKFTQESKLLEIYYENEEKCMKWYKAVQEVKNPPLKKKPTNNEDSFTPLSGLEEEEKISRFTILDEKSNSTFAKTVRFPVIA